MLSFKISLLFSFILVSDINSFIQNVKLVLNPIRIWSHILTMPFEELTEKMGGSGKAKIIWENLKIGINPLLSFEEGEKQQLSDKAKLQLISLLNNDSLLSNNIVQETLSDCGTKKLLLKLNDGQSIESVLIPSYKFDRTTLCVSTQIGCDRGCAFCLTGKNLIFYIFMYHVIE